MMQENSLERQQALEISGTQRTQAQVNEMVRLSELYLHKGYLQRLSDTQIAPLRGQLRKIEPGSNLRLIQVDAILRDKDTKISQKIKNLFGAIETFDAAMLLIVNGKRDKVDVYIGVCADTLEKVNPAFNTFVSSLSGVLPGCKYRQLKNARAMELLRDVFPAITASGQPENHAMACVSTFPTGEHSGQSDPYEAIAKLDVLIDGMRGKPFSMVLLNKTVNDLELSAMQQQLEMLYSQLAPYERIQFSTNESETDSVNLNFSHAVNANESYSTGITHSVSHTHGTGKNVTETDPDEHAARTQAGLGLLGAAAAVAAVAFPAVGAAASGAAAGNMLQSLFFGSALANVFTNVGTLTGLMDRPRDKSVSTSEHEDHSVSESRQVTFSTSEGTTDTSGYSIGNNQTAGSSTQFTMTNKFISGLLGELDRELEQIRSLKREGAFAGAAYFIAGEEETAITAANIYRAMTQSDTLASMRSPINCWADSEKLTALTAYLCRGAHPVFQLEGMYGPTAEAAQLIGLGDTPAYFSMPERSVPGFIVSEYAGFSRDVISQSGSKMSAAGTGGSVNIGHIYHMGRVEAQTPIDLTVDDLTKHLFVTGATGVGKSNFCYQLLDQLLERGIHTLVIEPAKGEYAGVFGGRNGFHVFGADPQRSPVLRINPFAFPEGVSVIQHVERLMDIFNAAWPMYSAMPAILKDAIEKIYADRGFDSILGIHPEGTDFPCFDDLLEALPQIIKSSAYSAEVQGNYIGALVTRVKSLTNGIYGIIFGRNEVGDSTLFDGDVIVDISRIGSSETKALIMGVLTMRLNEYRMCSGLVNSPLKHITLLEEAHNLLRGQTPGSPEGTNVRAASIEMITNAIAEMRTYGEGFIIADQSPSVLDQSVIRNTQTKVVFMLPDRNDREIVGNSLSLSDDQKQEVARLSPGVAAVYQNGWTSAVLSKINFFPKEKICPFVYDSTTLGKSFRELSEQCLAVILSGHLHGGKSSISPEKMRRLVEEDYTLYGERAAMVVAVLRHYLESGMGPEKDSELSLITRLLPLDAIIKSAGTAEGSQAVKQWAGRVKKKLGSYATLTDDEVYALVSCGIHKFYPGDAGKRQSFRMLYLTYCRPDTGDTITGEERNGQSGSKREKQKAESGVL